MLRMRIFLQLYLEKDHFKVKDRNLISPLLFIFNKFNSMRTEILYLIKLIL